MIDVLDLKDEGGAEPCFRINGNISLSKTNRIEDVSLSLSQNPGKENSKGTSFLLPRLCFVSKTNSEVFCYIFHFVCLSLSAILPRGGNPLEAWLHILYPLPTNGVTADQGKTTPKI